MPIAQQRSKVVGAMLGGALDYFQWPFNAHLLHSAFGRLVIEGERKLQQERRRLAAKAKIDYLTRRERNVLVHLAEGFSNKEMARALNISPRTVEIHRGNMMRKLNAQSTADVVRIALYGGLDEELHFAA